jgi:peptide/nickel transport system permease protein
MISFLRFLAFRLFSVLLTMVVITAVLYAIVMMTPPEVRAEIYIPRGMNLDRLSPEQMQQYINRIVKENGLNDPYPLQYTCWVANLLQGEWGYSPTMSDNILDALLIRTPATLELTLYTLIFLIPSGLVFGAIAGWNRNQRPDYIFRASAFVAAAIPNFVLAIVLMAVFYVGLHWFPPGRIGDQANIVINSPAFISYTGLITVDGLLNQRMDITFDAARHLVLPIFTLGLLHWATLGRVVRASMIEEMQKEYILAAKARGLSDRTVLWRHPFPNVIAPALASSALSAATLVTGVFVVERIYNIHGVSEIVMSGLLSVPDAAAALGYTVYNVIVVLLVMLSLDIVRALVDPRAREGW